MTISAAATGELAVEATGGSFGAGNDSGFEFSFSRLTYHVDVDNIPIIGPSTVKQVPNEKQKNFAVGSGRVPWDGSTLMQFGMQAEVVASANIRKAFAGVNIHSLALFFNTLSWGGISDVTDEFGNPVASFTALGESGVDWATPAPVPLPAAFWLLGPALAGFGLLRRRLV